MAVTLALVGASGVRAQDTGDAAGMREPLTIWIVRPITAADRAVRQTQKDLQDIQQYRETTAGGFGKAASETGQTAGSYGKPSSEEGRPASEAGQTAGSYGQTAGSLPSDVTSQTAGSYGQTAGSFGQSASSYTGAPSSSGYALSPSHKRTALDDVLKEFRESSDRQIRVAEVPGLELQDRLHAMEGKNTFPDILIADQMPQWWEPAMSQMTVRRMADLPALQVFADEAQPVKPTPVSRPYAHAYGLVEAAHPEATREFLEWWLAGRRFQPFALGPKRATPLRAESLAREAVAIALAGGAIDSMADPGMARFNSSLTIANALGFAGIGIAPDLKTDIGVIHTGANDHFALVQLHVVCLSRKIYGELFPLVLLRTDSHGEWRVLQITFGIRSQDAEPVQRLLDPYASNSQEVAVAAPVAASPLDGDRRMPGTGLRVAWDAPKEDGLLLLEWQVRRGERALASSVMLVPNQEGRAHAEATAPFANTYGNVRWRVWALGHGGVVQLGDWRTVEMR